jgi:hypothetical protein
MKKWEVWIVRALLASGIILCLLSWSMFFSRLNAKELKYLHYRYNDNVVITLSNVDCMIPEIKDEYPWAAIATRVDGNRLIACYKGEGENVVIQWYKGDKSVFPGNVFLVDPNQDKTYKKVIPNT